MLVAASDALTSTKMKADYICTGTDDQEQIEAAINALHSNGGTVNLSEGTFSITDPLMLTSSKIVRLWGQGPMTTVLDVDVDFTEDAIKLDSGHHHEVSGLGVQGTYRVGVLLQNAGYCALSSLKMIEPILAGVRAETSNCVNKLRNLVVVDSQMYGFWMYGNGNLIESCHARRSASGGGAAFRIQDSGSTYISPLVDKHEQGLYITQYAQGVSIQGAYLEGCNRGIYVRSTASPIPIAVTIDGAFVYDCTTPLDVQQVNGWSLQGLFVGG